MINRRPSLEIWQWDSKACEAAVTAQLLFKHGNLEEDFDRNKFDERIGRVSGQLIAGLGHLELLLDSGFNIVGLNPDDSWRINHDIDYARKYAADRYGYSDEDASILVTESYHKQMRDRYNDRVSLRDKYPGQFQDFVRDVTFEDIASVEDEKATMAYSIGNRSGVHLIAGFGLGRSEGLEVYDPSGSMTVKSITDIELPRSVTIYTK